MRDVLQNTIPYTPPEGSSANDFEMLCAADHPAQPVEWLWPGRIPIGKVTLLVGDPGLGKSLVALDVAARVSRGAAWPDQKRQGDKEKGRQGDTASKPFPSLSPCLPVSLSSPPNASATNPNDSAAGSVLILSADDDLPDTIRPRLDANGADPNHVFVLPSIADLRHDFQKLRAAIDRAPNCRLIIVDPVNAYVGPSDSHFHTVVRRVLAPLAQLAAEKGIAVLAVTHLRKNDGAAIQRAAGSMGFVAAARAIWTVCRDHANPERILFLPVKNNLAPLGTGLAYTIEPQVASGAPAIAWQSTPVMTPAAEALAPVQRLRGPEAEELNAASQWLRGELAQGPREADIITIDGMTAGFSERTLRRALYALGGQTIKRSFYGGWSWSLAASPDQHQTPADPKQPGHFDETWPLGENNQDSRPDSAPIPHVPPTDPKPMASFDQPQPPAPPRPQPLPVPEPSINLPPAPEPNDDWDRIRREQLNSQHQQARKSIRNPKLSLADQRMVNNIMLNALEKQMIADGQLPPKPAPGATANANSS